jgi:hypothetical protein
MIHGVVLVLPCSWSLDSVRAIIRAVLLLLLLTVIGLMPGGSVTKIGRTYKRMDIHSKETNMHLTTKQHVHLTKKQHISHFTVQYKCNEQNTRYKK